MAYKKGFLFSIFLLLLFSYLLSFLFSMIHGTSLATIAAIVGLIPVLLYIFTWPFLLRFSDSFKPYHHSLGFFIIISYFSLGIILFSMSMNIPVMERFLLVGFQFAIFLVFYLIGDTKFDPKGTSRKIDRSFIQDGKKIYFKEKRVTMESSYERKFKYSWMERLYAKGKFIFFLVFFLFSLLGGSAGLVLLHIIEGLEIGGIHSSPHSIGMFFTYFIFIPLISFSIPMVRFNFLYWKKLDEKIKKEFGEVQYLWES